MRKRSTVFGLGCSNIPPCCFYLNSEWEAGSEGHAREPVEIWMKRHVHSLNLDMTDPNEADTVLLSNGPTLKCLKYAKMKAYGNHWRVENEVGRSMTSYDCGVACFEANEQSYGSGKDYVGLLEDIFVPDYGCLKTPIIIFGCQWKKRTDNHNNSTYIRDSDGFLVVNFKHNLSRAVDPYVFPSQCTQVFFSDDDSHPPGSQWKVVLRKEARGRRKMEEDDDIFITTNVQTAGDVPSCTFVNPPNEPDLAGAIVLNDADNALALQSFERTSTFNSTASITRRATTTSTTGNKRRRRV